MRSSCGFKCPACPTAAAAVVVISYRVTTLRLAAYPYHLTLVINKLSILADAQTASRLHADAFDLCDAGLHLIRPQAYARNVGYTESWPHVAAADAAADDDDDALLISGTAAMLAVTMVTQ